jgi:aminoglycoside phosphotransferase (APT) family kinase protein
VVSDVEHLVPAEGLRRYLDSRFGTSDAGAQLSRLGEGHSNLTFLVRRGEDAWVLRRPPRGDIIPGTHEMHREFRVMKALHDAGSDVPVPQPFDLCEDASFIGAPFYLMALVDGLVFRGPFPEPFAAPDARHAIGIELVDRLADIHLVDWQGIGLADLAKRPDTFLERNLGRMQQIYDSVRHRDVPEVDQAGDWLRAHAPQQRGSALSHGDYKLDNVMFEPELPPRINAVVDWEVSTIGDPMVDVGWMLYFSPEENDPERLSVVSDANKGGGYPTRAEIANRYAQATGRTLDDLRFYVAFAGWKIAIIMETSNHRFKQGQADDAMFSALDAVVPALAQRSLDVIAGDMPVGV